jgi:hypothetical protein
MAFFNLTQLGVQDPIKTATSTAEGKTPSTGGAPSEPSHNESYEKYRTMLKKHQRNEKGPNELYNTPITTSMNYGRWMKDGHTKQQSWTHVPRRAHVNSEMTRFVDEMSLTNRDFSLF